MTRVEKRHMENLRKMVAFYQGEAEDRAHPVESEYRRLMEIPPEKRRQYQMDRLALLGRQLAEAAEASDGAFRKRLNGFLFSEKCRTRFSLCLDCDLHNRCGRYAKHLGRKVGK